MRARCALSAVVTACALGAAMHAQQPPAVANPFGPSWAFPNPEGPLPAEGPGPHTVPGSTRTYTMKEIDDLRNPPDWFPERHPAPPPVVQRGRAVLACGSCHLMDGVGHPESSDLRGLTADYFAQQMTDFRTGVRRDYAGVMNIFAKEVTDQEVREAAAWFAALKPTPVGKVVEAAMVPRTYVGPNFMRFVRREGGMEPIGNRIITVSEDEKLVLLRDPRSGFISYVPPGSIARGKALVETGGGGKTIACAICHGEGQRGLGNSPRIAGVHPIYTARQLMLFKDGRRNGVNGQLMKRTVAQLNDEDIVAIAAYLGSLTP